MSGYVRGPYHTTPYDARGIGHEEEQADGKNNVTQALILFQADEMVNNLRTAFKELVDESVWMDKETQVSNTKLDSPIGSARVIIFKSFNLTLM